MGKLVDKVKVIEADGHRIGTSHAVEIIEEARK